MQKYKQEMGIRDINNRRNGLLWCDFIEEAYERWALCFSSSPLPGKFKIHIVNKEYLDLPLFNHSVFAKSTPTPEQRPLHDMYQQLVHGKTFRLVQCECKSLGENFHHGHAQGKHGVFVRVCCLWV
jgi:hypothetical protein